MRRVFKFLLASLFLIQGISFASFRAEIPGLDQVGSSVSSDLSVVCDANSILQTTGSGTWSCIQPLTGSTSSGGNLTLQSTSHATKGKILFGTSAYDEVNNRLGIGTASPAYLSTIKTTSLLESAPLGSELLSSVGWTSAGWTGDFASGFTHTTGNTSALSYDVAISSGSVYQLIFTISGKTAGYVLIGLGGADSNDVYSTNKTEYFSPKTLNGTGDLIITPSSTFNGLISNISVKEITGTYNPTFAIVDNADASVFEMRNSLSSVFSTYIGKDAGRYSTAGSLYNTGLGYQALYFNTSGYNNTAIGAHSLYYNTTGQSNTAFGMETLAQNTTGRYNTAVGDQSLHYNTTGYYNASLGVSALQENTTGYFNTAVGVFAGRYLTGGTANQTSNSSIFLGYDSRAKQAGDTNEIVIGTSAMGYGSNTVVLGNSSITKTALYGAISITPSTVTVTSAGVAIPITSSNVEVTTDGDSDLDNGTLADGATVGQEITIYVKAVGNAADSFKITPATMLGGTIITFAASPLGKGCSFRWTSSGWVCTGQNGGTIS